MGGEVPKEDAVKEKNRYYHKECYEKKKFKEEMRNKLSHFTKKEVNITLKKAIDIIGYPLGYIEFVAKNNLDECKTAYNLLYYLKFETNYKAWLKGQEMEQKIEINQSIKKMDIEQDEVSFTYKKREPKRFKIY